MRNDRRNRWAALCLLCVVCSSYSVAQQNKSLEARVSALELRVKNLESRLQTASGTPAAQFVGKSAPAKAAYRSPLSAKLFTKKIHSGAAGEGDKFGFLITLSNSGSVDIRSFKGDLIFKDPSGNAVLEFFVDIEKPIPAGGTNTWYGGIAYDSTKENHRRIVNMDPGEVTLDIDLKEIQFSDGSRKVLKGK